MIFPQVRLRGFTSQQLKDSFLKIWWKMSESKLLWTAVEISWARSTHFFALYFHFHILLFCYFPASTKISFCLAKKPLKKKKITKETKGFPKTFSPFHWHFFHEKICRFPKIGITAKHENGDRKQEVDFKEPLDFVCYNRSLL